MKAGDLRPRHWARSLSTRLIAFLSIALLPLGAVAVLQTVQVIEEARRLAERDAVARTAQAASEQQAVIERAFGAAYALGETAARLADSPDTCSSIMAQYIMNRPDFVFAGFIRANGLMDCNNAGTVIDYSGQPDWEAFAENPVPTVQLNQAGDVSRQSVYVVFVPVFDPDTRALSGGQAISIPAALSRSLFANDEDGLDLALIDPDGNILTTSTEIVDLSAFERRGVVPKDLEIPRRGLLISATERNRFSRPTAVVPLIPGELYVLGLWEPGGIGAGITALNRTIPIFPVVMWLASLAVAYITVRNLILNPLSRLSGQMRRYSADDPGGAFISLPDAPTEITEIADSYNTLLNRVASDTARLQDNVAEKEILLREVHHRVKNNLQLISSILNMQMRGVTDENARRILSRVQDRVMSLSSVHRALYTDTQLQSVRADLLLEEIIKGIGDLATSASRQVDVNVDLGPVTLDPDQAVPLSLLATEAMTNAVKYVGARNGTTASIDVRLTQSEAGAVSLSVRNSRGPAETLQPESHMNGTGLGARLIASFASQLGGQVEIDQTDDTHDLRLHFEKLKEA